MNMKSVTASLPLPVRPHDKAHSGSHFPGGELPEQPRKRIFAFPEREARTTIEGVFFLRTVALGLLWLLSLSGCKSIAPGVAAGATRSPVVREGAAFEPTPGSRGWYRFLPDKAPGACLQTARPLRWRFPGLDFGSWEAHKPDSAERVMSARGECLTIDGGYVWDGATLGTTTPRNLAPTLVHDALYHALMHRAPLKRRTADRALLTLLRAWRCPHPRLTYCAVRLGGGLFNCPDDPPTLLVTSPAVSAGPHQRKEGRRPGGAGR